MSIAEFSAALRFGPAGMGVGWRISLAWKRERGDVCGQGIGASMGQSLRETPPALPRLPAAREAVRHRGSGRSRQGPRLAGGGAKMQKLRWCCLDRERHTAGMVKTIESPCRARSELTPGSRLIGRDPRVLPESNGCADLTRRSAFAADMARGYREWTIACAGHARPVRHYN